MNDKLNSKQELMLEEYKKCQDSAEHNDHMSWLMSSVLVVASITLLGFLLSLTFLGFT